MKLDEIYKQLSDYASQQEKLICRFPCDAEYNVPSWDIIYDALEIIRNHEIGDFENVIDDEPTDEEMMSSFGTKWHDGL